MFFLFYFLLKFIKGAFFVRKVVKTHKENMKNFENAQSGSQRPQRSEDIIDAEYKVVDDNE